MTPHATFGRLFGYTALSVAGALAALTVSHGMAAAAPWAPLPSDDQAPAVPFDPGALVNAIDDYANLLSILTGGHRAQPAVGTVEQPSGAYPMLPGVPMLPGEP